ncbi:MAG: PBP1A family penicillin-binding protein [Acidobacteria bacterium]|nr:PBP1A family penicillin-binding protein [Acidobacteriota bacterium]
MAIEVTSVVEKRRTHFIKAAGQVFKHGRRAALLRKRHLVLQSLVIAIVIALALCVTFLTFSYLSYSRIVDARLANGYLTSRAGIYAAPRTLRAGQSLTQDKLIELLRRAGYLESNASDVWNGSFTAEENAVLIRPRQSGGSTRVVRVGFDKKGRVSELTGDDAPLEAYTLEPEVLTNDSMKTGARNALSYKEIPQTLVQAILSIEDRRFFEHRGVDLIGIGRAIMRNVGDDEIGQGGSTITQQLVKNTYLSSERTFKRKFAEAMLSFTLERRLSKEDIFALYCNEIYLGQRGSIGVRGVEQAAHVYFGKELKDLSLAESAMIAGMIQSPNRYAPDRHTEAATSRRNTVIAAMLRDGVITKEQSDAATSEQLAVAPLKDEGDAVAPYFIDYVNRTVEAQLASQTDERGGVRVYTTIDLDLQELAEGAIKKQLERLDKVYKNREAKPQAALVALDAQTGDVLAMVGGRGYGESQMNRATDALRQPGSTFKPFVYAAALESGLSPVSMYADAPQEFVYDRNAKYRPANYGGGYSMRNVMMRDALVKSLNVVTVDVAMRTGLSRVARYAESFGLPKPQPYPALALGTTEATPLSLAAAYTAFANSGVRVEPNPIARITDASGLNLKSDATRQRKVIDATTAYMITDMLSDVIDHGTARAARGAVKRTAIAGKTGTSRDGWFIGYTPRLVVAVWLGFDDNKQLGLTGAEAALPAWTEFVKGAIELRPELGGESFDRPEGIITVAVDPESGQLANASCPQSERVATTAALAPNLECFIHQTYDATVATLDEYSTDEYSTQAQTRALPQAELPPPPTPHAATRVITDTRGRPVLVNDLSVRNQR